MSFLDKFKDMNEMRKQAKELQTALAKEVVVGDGGNGLFKVTMDGNQNVIKVEIDDKIVGDKAQLERCAKDAFMRALDALKKVMVTKFSGFMR